jgi:hypothetical protein
MAVVLAGYRCSAAKACAVRQDRLFARSRSIAFTEPPYFGCYAKP